MNSYEKGKRWGYAVFKRNCEFYGEVGIGKSDKASITCSQYLETNRRRGKKLGSYVVLCDVPNCQRVYIVYSLYGYVYRRLSNS